MISIYSYRKPIDVLNKFTCVLPEIKKYMKENPNVPVLEGSILHHENGKNKKRYLFLVGRILIICKPKGTKFRPKFYIRLSSRKDVAVVTDSQYKVPHVEFRVYGRWTYILFAQSQEERDYWVDEMQKYINLPAPIFT